MAQDLQTFASKLVDPGGGTPTTGFLVESAWGDLLEAVSGVSRLQLAAVLTRHRPTLLPEGSTGADLATAVERYRDEILAAGPQTSILGTPDPTARYDAALAELRKMGDLGDLGEATGGPDGAGLGLPPATPLTDGPAVSPLTDSSGMPTSPSASPPTSATTPSVSPHGPATTPPMAATGSMTTPSVTPSVTPADTPTAEPVSMTPSIAALTGQDSAGTDQPTTSSVTARMDDPAGLAGSRLADPDRAVEAAGGGTLVEPVDAGSDAFTIGPPDPPSAAKVRHVATPAAFERVGEAPRPSATSITSIPGFVGQPAAELTDARKAELTRAATAMAALVGKGARLPAQLGARGTAAGRRAQPPTTASPAGQHAAPTTSPPDQRTQATGASLPGQRTQGQAPVPGERTQAPAAAQEPAVGDQRRPRGKYGTAILLVVIAYVVSTVIVSSTDVSSPVLGALVLAAVVLTITGRTKKARPFFGALPGPLILVGGIGLADQMSTGGVAALIVLGLLYQLVYVVIAARLLAKRQ